MKDCEFCGESIPDNARRCRYCEEYVDDPPPRRRTGRGRRGVPCPTCGSASQRNGPWPWYLGTIGALLCKAVICNKCGHEFDAKKPQADLGRRKLHLALAINGFGALGIIAIIGSLILFALSMGVR